SSYSSFYYCNTLQCIHLLLSQERFKHVTVYKPYKDMHMTIRETDEGGIRQKIVEEMHIYNEMHTADWWWDAQVSPSNASNLHSLDTLQHTIPRKRTLIPIIGSLDQSHFTNYFSDKNM